MKKSSLLMIPLVAVAALLGVLLSNTNNVEAANNEACSAKYFLDTYIQNIEVEYNGNTAILTNNSGINLTYSFIADADTSNPSTGNFANGSTINLTVSEGGKVYFYLAEDMSGTCTAAAGSEVGSISINNEGLINNPLYNDSVCVNYRNRWGDNSVMQNAVPYCYQAQTYSEYSREEVQGWIDTAESLYESVGSSSDEITIDSSYQEVDDVKNTDTLVCDAFSTNNYETMHKYYHVDTENDGNGCEVTCKEEIEVNFSDPVATQAGLCFQYLIEIKSKVVCDASYTAAPPTRKQVCYPTPVCYSGRATFDAGGPNEDFDACVLECDGGKYSQSCIDRCYSEVYENSNSSKKTTKTSDSNTITKDDVKAFSGLYLPSDSFYEMRKLANSCPGTGDAVALYNYMQSNPSGHYSGGTWISDYGSGVCSLGPYYFRSLEQTRKTIAMMNGSFSYSGVHGGYDSDGNGILRENYGNGHCDEHCEWRGSCGSNTALTEGQAQAEYEKAVEEYLAAKQACEQKAATCTNETTDYKIVVDNVDKDNETDDDSEEFSSSQKLNGDTVTGDFPSMVILTDGSCEDGEDDPWHYHNIITFPGTWVNNKTGQTVHSMEPGHEDFYTYIGNEYCTKLNSVPVNTAWYDWKVNQNGNSSALTDDEKSQIESSLEMNIHGSIDNYGYFGWNFDIECFYAIGSPEEECSTDDPNFPNCDDDNGGDGSTSGETPVNDYQFRSISLDNLFPTTESGETSRQAGYNWTCEATNLENTDYLIQPVTTMNEIQSLGDSIYESDEYLDYHIVLTPESMNKVRAYNNSMEDKGGYAGPTSDNSSEVLTAGNDKTAGITVYRSYLLHRVLDSSELLKSGVIGCNNEDNGECPTGDAAIDKTTTCYNEYMAQSSILKGAN